MPTNQPSTSAVGRLGQDMLRLVLCSECFSFLPRRLQATHRYECCIVTAWLVIAQEASHAECPRRPSLVCSDDARPPRVTFYCNQQSVDRSLHLGEAAKAHQSERRTPVNHRALTRTNLLPLRSPPRHRCPLPSRLARDRRSLQEESLLVPALCVSASVSRCTSPRFVTLKLRNTSTAPVSVSQPASSNDSPAAAASHRPPYCAITPHSIARILTITAHQTDRTFASPHRSSTHSLPSAPRPRTRPPSCVHERSLHAEIGHLGTARALLLAAVETGASWASQASASSQAAGSRPATSSRR